MTTDAGWAARVPNCAASCSLEEPGLVMFDEANWDGSVAAAAG